MVTTAVVTDNSSLTEVELNGHLLSKYDGDTCALH